MNKQDAPSAIVVGAGLAGLSAGYRLRQAGWQVTVLEAGSYAGGRAATIHADGYLIDTGATQITSGYTEYLALCDELGLSGELLDSSQLIGIVRDNRIHELDGGRWWSGLLSPIVGFGGKLVFAKTILDKMFMKPRLDYLHISDCHRHDNESIRSYAERRLNAEVYDYLVAPLLRCNFLRNPDQSSKLDWFAMLDSVAKQKMLTLRGGSTRLPTMLAGQLDVRLNAPAKRVERIGETVAVTWIEQGVERSVTADACVVATRLPEAVAISPAYAGVAGALNDRLGYSRGLTVHLGFRQATHSKVIGVLVPAPEQAQIALVWLEHNKNPECAPQGHSLITCYFDDAGEDDCYRMPDENVIGIAKAYLERLFPELKGQCDLARVSRWPLAIPFPEPGVYREIHRLKARLAPADRIQYAADYFTCVGQNSAIYYGRRAAENLAGLCP